MTQQSAIIIISGLLFLAGLAAAFSGYDRTLFLPAPLSPAHARLAGDCDACHASRQGVTEEKCLACHGKALDQDSHPLAILNKGAEPAAPPFQCASCHREHQPTKARGYTGPENLCTSCHGPGRQGTPESHFLLADKPCVEGGCHSFHSNVTREMVDAAIPQRVLAKSRIAPEAPPPRREPITDEAVAAMRADPWYHHQPAITAQYELSPHFGTRATCVYCHTGGVGGLIDLDPPSGACIACHEPMTLTYRQGAHGLGHARKSGLAATASETGCGACHDVHAARTEGAGIDACLRCHQEDHARNYKGSNHYRYLSDPIFANKAVTGVDCAGCHMPRQAFLKGATDHNVSLTVTSRELMAREVCANCHGLFFALSSLHDPLVVASNFTYPPRETAPGVGFAFRSDREDRP